MSKAPPITLTVDGKRYGGWQTIRVTRSIEALAGSFSLTLTEKWAGQPKAWPIADDAECVLKIDELPIITGFIDKTSPAFDTNSRSITVAGRDRAGDITDCSAQLGTWSFANVNVLELAKKICAPYRVGVALQPGLVAQSVAVPKKFSIDPGDTAGEALAKLLKLAGLLAISDGLGGLLLTRTGTERLGTALIEGQNLKKASGSFDVSKRYRNYVVLGSHKGRDDLNGSTAARVKGTATDLNARSGRTLVIRLDTGVTVALAKKRAEWEASTRSASGESLAGVVHGWKESAFEAVWPLNKIVRVKAPSCRVDGEALIAGVTLIHDASTGTTTALDLRNPAAFTPDPTIARAGGAGGGKNYWREIKDGV